MPPAVSPVLSRRVAAFIRKHRLAEYSGAMQVAVSGGPDSVCLLHIMAGLRETLGLRLRSAHLNHRLRGAESDEDAAYVERLCRKLDVPLTVQSIGGEEYRRRHKLTLEEAGRACRHAFLAEAAWEHRCDTTLLAHTANDQAETVLMHVLRGAGLQGLKGMDPMGGIHVAPLHRSLSFARPLLTTWRTETEAYCAENALSPRMDSSNVSPQFTRNRIRLELLPHLREFNPRVDEALVRLAENAGESVQFLEDQTRSAHLRLVRKADDEAVIDRKGLAALPEAVQSHLLRDILRDLRGDLEGITSSHVRRLLRAASGPTGKTFSLPDGLECAIDYEVLQIRRSGSHPVSFPPLPEEPVPLTVPGSTDIPTAPDEHPWRVAAVLHPREQVSPGEGILASNKGLPPPGERWEAYLDGSLAQRPLWVRRRRPGDRFQPLGMTESKKLQDFMVDEKVPRAERDHVPLVCDSEGILWVAGYRLSERARISPDATEVLHLSFDQPTLPRM